MLFILNFFIFISVKKIPEKYSLVGFGFLFGGGGVLFFGLFFFLGGGGMELGWGFFVLLF